MCIARRTVRLRHFKAGRRRLFAAGVLPAAACAAEHEPWQAADLKRLSSWTVEAHGVRAPGVPASVAMLAVDPMLDPAFRLPFAAVERWAREVFMAAAVAPDLSKHIATALQAESQIAKERRQAREETPLAAHTKK